MHTRLRARADRSTRSLRRTARWLLLGTAGAVGALIAADSANAATFATFNHGVLTVFGDGRANSVTVSRDAAGAIVVNNGAIRVIGGTPTVANTALIQVFGLNGNDTLLLEETTGALPRAFLFGGVGNDRLTGGEGDDLLFGQSGNDTLDARGGFDVVFGGGGNDSLTGGDADDQTFGGSGNDMMIWNPGDDTDLNEGGAGTDTVQVNGGNGAETFTTTANGTRVRFDRLDPAPFAIDIGTSENVVLNANGGDDSYSTTGDLAALIAITADGGAGADTLLGSNGVDRLLGGDGDDFVDGQQGNDIALTGSGDDRFQWDPGDGSDVVEGQDGTDTMVFNGSGGDELFEAAANGQRLRFTRNLGNIVMDTDDIEVVDVNALGGADTMTVNDLSGTDVVELNANLAGVLGGTAGDAAADTVVVNGTNAADLIDIVGAGDSVSVLGLTTGVSVTRSEGANDALVVNSLGGDDGITATSLPAGVITPTIDGGADDDQLLGSQGVDTFLGGDGTDFVLGDNGNDVGLLGAGDDTFQWNPGDGNDTIEGQAGADRMRFVGANVAEAVDVSANGGRVRFFRNVANVVMDLDDVETVDFEALGGADNVVVGDLSGTDVSTVRADVGAGDGQADSVAVTGTNGDDVALVTGSASVVGLAAQVDIAGSDGSTDVLTVSALAGEDVVEASGLQADAVRLVEIGDAGDDVLVGSTGDDVLRGGAGDDVLVGGGGVDVLDGGDGDDVEIQNILAEPGTSLVATSTDQVTSATTADAAWIAGHVQVFNGTTWITNGGRSYALAVTDLSSLVVDAVELLAAAQPNPVGDFVWLDTDGDGVQDAGEAGLADVAVRLIDADGNVVTKAVTDGAGRYELVPTEPGQFTLEVVIPDGFQPTLANVGSDDAVDSDVDPARVVVGEAETTVRVAVSDSAESPADLDVGLVATPTEPTTTTTVPATTVPTAAVPTTTVPTTTVPTTTVPTTAATVPTTAAPTTVAPTTAPASTVPATAAPTTVAPTTEVPTTLAPTTTAAPAG